MRDFIIAAIIIIILGAAIIYIRKAKKTGAKCIGCPAGGNCPSHSRGKHETCGCGCADSNEN